jgi:hypothetical protein
VRVASSISDAVVHDSAQRDPAKARTENPHRSRLKNLERFLMIHYPPNNHATSYDAIYAH